MEETLSNEKASQPRPSDSFHGPPDTLCVPVSLTHTRTQTQIHTLPRYAYTLVSGQSVFTSQPGQSFHFPVVSQKPLVTTH